MIEINALRPVLPDHGLTTPPQRRLEGLAMEFHVQIAGSSPDLGAVSEEIHRIDPSATVDIDADGGILRIAAAMDSVEVQALLGRAGFPVAPEQVRQLPSTCCGGCGG